MIAAVAAPLLGQIPLGFKVPVVVLEVVLGIVIGPHVLDLVHFDGFVAMIFNFAMATTLFMAGMELDFGEIKGRPLVLALGGWGISAILAIIAVGAIRLIPPVHAPMMVAIALCTTGLGILMPIFRDSDQLGTGV
ncbi:MAG: cation:proton antiporter [Candidatus Competibacteraceae bacterium]